jgi:integrase
VKQAGWYRVRFRLDVQGQYARTQKNVKICPVCGPGLLTKPERERRKVEIVNSYGANSVERFNQVVVGTTERTFKEQAKWWLNQVQTRAFPKPVKPATARGWQSYLAKWLNPSIGDVSLMDVKTGVLKSIVEKLGTAGLSPKSVRNIVQVITMVKSSAVDEDGNEIYPYKWNFEFAQVPTVENQRTPMFTGEEITKLVARADGQIRIAFILLAASGLRAGELFGLEVKHFAGNNTLSVEQSVWEGRRQSPKTKNARRQVDLHPSVATLLREFIGHRKDGFIFRSEEGTAIHQSNFLRRHLHPLLEQLGIEKQGFHGFRRFRVTHLESSTVPPALVKYWTGHANSSDGEVVRRTVTDKYVKMEKDAKFRAEVAERIGIGFELPRAETVEVVPSVPNSQKMEVVVSA